MPDHPGVYQHPDMVTVPLLIQEGTSPKLIQYHTDTGTLANRGHISSIRRLAAYGGV